MPLWGSKDDGANTPYTTVNQVNKAVSNTARFELYQNTTPNVYFTHTQIGTFGVSPQEESAAEASIKPPHAGWVLRKEGRGGRAGRVEYEVLVAMGSLTDGAGAQDNVAFPDWSAKILSGPTNTTPPGVVTDLAVTARGFPAGANLIYQWQRTYPSVNWTNVGNTTIFASAQGDVAANLRIIDNSTLSGNVFRCVINVSNGTANTVFSSNVV